MEQRLRQLIVGYDFTDASQAAVRAAAFFGKTIGSRIRVVTSVRHSSDAKLTQMVSERQRTEVGAILAAEGDLPFQVDYSVEWDSPLTTIFRASRDYEGDLICVGSRGRGGRSGRGLGPDAERMARRSHLPVLLLHPDKPFPPRRILCAVDFSAASERALGWAMDIARLGGSSVDVLHVLEPGSISVARLLGNEAPPEDGGGLEAAKQALAAFVQKVRVDVKLEARLRYGLSSEEILAALDENETYDLLTIATIGRHAVVESLVGGTTERVLRDVPCSVLTAKPDAYHLKR